MAGESSCKYVCSICGAMPPPSKCTAKFCSKCGKPLVLIPVDLHEKQERVPQQRKCVACQKELEPDENFCGDCGKPANETKSPTNQTPEGNATGRSPQDTVEHAIDPESEKSEPRQSLKIYTITVSEAKCIAVTFHVLVPHKIWGWDQNKTILRICFGHKDLGNWNGTTTEFRTTRDIEAGYFMMEGTVNIPISITEGSRALPYTYAVCEYQNPDVVSCYEYLYNCPDSGKGNVSRCLIIPTAYSHGHYHQYDTMVYPRLKLKTWKQKAWELIKTDFPSHHVMQRDCLTFYLAKHYNILSRCSIIHDFNIKHFCDEALHIFLCLYQQRMCKDMVAFVKEDEGLKQDYLQSWLLQIVNDLNHYEVKSVDENAFRLVAAVTLACCIQNFISLDLIKLHDIGSEKLANLLCLFHLFPAPHSKQCKDYEFLERIVPEDFRENAASAICTLSKHAARINSFDPLSWLRALPLVHFMRKQSNPFGLMTINPERIDFRSPNLQLQQGVDTAGNKGTLKMCESSFEEMKPFFQLDPLLLPLFVSVCPISELKFLIDHIPLSLFTLWIHRRFVEEIECINLSEAEDIMFWLLCIKSKLLSSCTTPDSMPDMLTATMYFLLKLKGKRYSNNAMAQCLKICGIVISLILHTAAIWYEDKVHEVIDEFRSKLKQYTKEWIDRVCDDGIIGEHSRMEWDERKANSELEVWESLCDLDIPKKLQLTWQSILVFIFRERIMKVYIANISELLFLVGSRKSIPMYVSDTVTTLVIERMDMMNEQAVTTAVSALNMARDNTGTADYICSVFNSLLRKRYPHGSSDVNLDDLFTWNLWPTFMKICSERDVNSNSCVTQGTAANVMFTHVEETLKGLWDQLSSGSVTVGIIRKLQPKQSQMKKLIDSCSKELGLHFEAFEQRLQELEAYQTHLKGVHLFCSSFSIPVEGMEDLKRDLDQDVNNLEIKMLCYYSKDEKRHIYPCFQSLSALSLVLPDFGLLIKNKIFSHLWKRCVDAVQEDDTKLSVSAICEIVWPRVIEGLSLLKKELLQKSLQLSDVDKYFSDLRCERDISEALETIWEWHNKFEIIQENVTCPNDCINSISNYWFLRDCEQAAQAVLTLRQELNQEGNFSKYDEIVCNVKSTLTNQTIQAITDQHEAMKPFATLFCGRRLQYLQALVKSIDVIKWLKKETKDVTDLQAFVNLTLATSAGEGDLNNDRLSTLSIVGNGYQSLIYDQPKDVQFEGLAEYYSVLWEAPKSNPKLPILLMDCNASLGLYKSVRESHGQDGQTCYGQLKIIQNCGHYVIRIPSKNNLADVVRVYIDPGSKFMTVDELMDLESKLILIQRKEDNSADLEQFFDTLRAARCVADLLLALRQVGSTQYAKCSVVFPCNVNVVAALQRLAKDMGCKLEESKTEIETCRQQFYCVNYYTTRQLLMLRKEFGMIRSGAAHSICSQVLVLLQSISTSITSEIVMTAIHKYLSEKRKKTSKHAYISQDIPLPSSDDTKTHPDKQDPLLSPEQKQLYMVLTSHLQYDSKLSLNAVDKFSDTYDAMNWCLEVLAEENKLVHEAFQHQEPQRIDFPADDFNICSESTNQLASEPELSVSPISDDESLTPIEQLCKCGYTLEQATEAVNMYGDNMEEVRQYLLKREIHANLSPRDSDEMDNDFDLLRHCTELKINNSQVEDTVTIAELGGILSYIPNECSIQRSFPSKQLKFGVPVLLIVKPENVLKTVLSLYMEDSTKPLPTLEEVLVCNEKTSEEEVTLLWRRAVGDPGFGRIFCLVHAEKLAYKVCEDVLKSLDKHTQGKQGYRLIIICCEGPYERSHFVSKLHLYHQQYMPVYSETKYADYLMQHFKQQDMMSAANIDCDKSCVRLVTSERPGMGKSLFVKRMARKLSGHLNTNKLCHITIPIFGPDVFPDKIIQFLCNAETKVPYAMIHFDIAPKVTWKVDTLLFSLLILKGLCDSQGNVWRCHASQLIVVEVTLPLCPDAQSLEMCTHSFLKLLPNIHFLNPIDAVKFLSKKENDDGLNRHLMDEKKLFSPTFQMVYRYLDEYDKNTDLDSFTFNMKDLEKDTLKCLQIILRSCSIPNPSWSEVKNFVKFLRIQLQSCETSPFCNTMELKGLKSFAVKFMILMSRDFATPSLNTMANNQSSNTNALEKYQIRKHWEQQLHPYLFFNRDLASLTYIGFNINDNGDLINPTNHELVEKSVISKQLVQDLKVNYCDFQESFISLQKNELLEKIGTVMGLQWLHDPDESYVLTADNTIKMLAIYMRFRCGIPVVLMGDTGCGKTHLIQYMCDLMLLGNGLDRENTKNLFILKVHGGTTEDDIIKVVYEAQLQAKLNSQQQLDTVLFFDEANTTEAIGLIKEIMCDHRVNGKHIDSCLKFIAACNPYKRHSEQMLKKLEEAGLGYYIRTASSHERFGNIPLRQLVYRVMDLPPSIQPFVYDFGQISSENERDYIRKLVQHHHVCKGLAQDKITKISEILVLSQQFMKQQKDECSFVSLRDVERAMIVFGFFIGIIPKFKEWAQKIEKTHGKQDKETCALILTLSVCYHAKLKERGAFESEVIKHFTSPLSIIRSEAEFQNVIKWYQDLLLDAMVIGPNAFIAKNQALRENVFMMAVCIELRIPLFLIGKPGSSKSLAKAIVASSMQGKTSKHPLLRHFKQVHMFSYQCSQLSTSQSIHDVFQAALCFQTNQNTAEFVSVVVLDEIGLAEDSPQLPLKVLHPLLEDGTGATIKTCIQKDRVAFIGISNWALDPAKMNRGIMVTRGDPNITELQFSAKGICSNKDDDTVTSKLQVLFVPLAEAYHTIVQETGRKKDFFGLRDFYSLIKMLYWDCSRSKDQELTWSILLNAIKRNFGGLQGCDPVKIFGNTISSYSTRLSLDSMQDIEKQSSSCNPTELELIESSLKNHDISWHGENRYLLFITENYAALQIIQSHLQTVIALSHNSAKEHERTKAFVLFGSSFPKDNKYTQICRNINQIKICMETGRPVILLNLEHLYESLYDVLNQHYIYHGENRYVDLGLQTHRVKCRVHNDFKLILIAEKSAVYDRFPTPLINRLEKHFIPISTIFAPWQHAVVQELQIWVNTFSSIASTGSYKFTNKDAFIGYQDETPATVVYHATQQVKQLKSDMLDHRELSNNNFNPSFSSCLCESNNSEESWGEMIFQQSKWLLLQTASPSALFRLRKSDFQKEEYINLNEMYFKEQFHFSLLHLLEHLLLSPSSSQMLQVTTHSHLLTTSEIKQLNQRLKLEVFCYELQEFDTEIDFCSTISTVFAKRESRKEALLIIQCESGHKCNDLIACARYKVHDELERAQKTSTTNPNNITHVLFIIDMPPNLNHQSTFIGFQSDHWMSLHLDELWPSDLSNYDIHAISECKLSDAFIGPKLCHSTELTTSSQYQRLHFCIHAAVSQIPNSNRAIDCVGILLDLIPKVSFSQTDGESFYSVLVGHIHRILQERENAIASDWILDEALNVQGLQHGGTFQNALIRKIDEVSIPIFAELIWWCDHFCNLDLIHECGSMNTAVKRFWLSIFKNPRIMSINYHNMVTKTSSHTALERNYKCRFPFSWIVKESVDTVWSHVLCDGDTESDMVTLCRRVDILLKETPVGEALEAVSEKDCNELFQYYLHDFVRSVHRSHHSDLSLSDKEYKHISNALGALCDSALFDTSFGSLTNKIASLKTLHWFFKTHIVCFGQLSWQLPGILERDHKPSSDEMVLHLQGAKAALKILMPPFERSEQQMQQWLQIMQYSQSAIHSALSLKSSTMIEELLETRSLWQMHLVAKLFVEHITLHHKDTMIYLRRIELGLKYNKKMDFSKGKTIEDILKVLKTIPRTQLDQQKGLSRKCNDFFVELVSTLCFSYWSTPDDKLAEILIQTVFDVDSSSDEIQDIQQVTYNIPVTKIILLHLLLQNRAEEIGGQLRNYCKKSKQSLIKHWRLCVLLIQCIEDALSKEWSLDMREASLIQHLSDASQYISQQTTDTDEIKEYLDSIAVLRFVLETAADILYNNRSPSSPITNALLDKTKAICTAATSASAEHCVLYLIKVIVRRYGLSSLKQIARNYSWVVPDDLMNENEMNFVDPFIIYGDAYISACESVRGVLHGENPTTLLSMMENCVVMSMLAIYSNLSNQQTMTNAPSQTISRIEGIVQQCLPLDEKLRSTAQSFLSSQQSGTLHQLTMSCQQSTTPMDLINVVVHAVTVISATNSSSILVPLFQMLTNPGSLKDKYLPTMPGDSVMESYQALSGQFYYCSKGHPYLVTECGHQHHLTCPTCGVPIGDRIQGGKSTVAMKNSTRVGYILGSPDEQSSTPAPVRGLTPASCSIIRALMHSMLLWESCNDKCAGPVGLVQLIPFVQEDLMPKFLCSHLEKDVHHLGKAIGRSYDEALIVIHLVLQDIVDRKVASASNPEPHCCLATSDSREAWEVQFQTTYIHSTLQSMNTKVQSVIDLNLRTKKQGCNKRLLSIAYENKKADESNIEHLLWSFRTKITLESVMQMIDTMNLHSSCPILHSFLNQEMKLRATKYLPDIVHLQQYFHERYTPQILYKKIAGKTVGHFLNDSGGDREKLEKMISSLSKAWKLVRDKLPDHACGRLKLNTKYLVPDITKDTNLECLIPMTTGYGVCTTLLVDLLVCTYNDFIETCRVASNSRWQPQRIPISHLDACHLINFEQQLLPVLISYCQYLNFMDTDTKRIQLNLAALEKCIMDQFVLGKPFIMFDVPLIVFKRELTSTLRKKIIQEQLTEQDRAHLCSALRTPNQLKNTLEDISILLGFLSSMGGNGETYIRDYANKTLRMKPPAVPQFLKLKHIVSIWQALSVQLAIATHQEPFDQLEEEFLSDLEQSQKDELDIVLRRFNLDNLLGILYELVESHLKFSSQEELSLPLVQTVKAFLEVCGAQAILEFNEFPGSITFKQIVATWKHIALYKKSHEHEKQASS